ncbi:bifunctional serine/threonine-protein kinase/ABC transporter substrate-binding protein [Streptomyces sp. S063]|uniref:bifunctional serine/threonine-protein kinase/ABC transporter substrate-binding protein n=1 Tax=Streptomyces sp. S063 TaxID=2005885 RepID=UPI00100849C1|nr:bifunctional serine/threonine-protein kinase/ABC transporter substrate-binding protein [Streptomyces sp. S063]
MRPLTSEDPRTVGPYRTLVRLGAGGMGVVYLARSAGGTLVAVKVIRAEHAADPAFRARFRREAEAATRITGPWVVPVLGADTEAREPWLATAFVPGPSLAAVVGARGALPTATVRALGSRLAAALVAVHRAGLIHRDVKPDNVLLALDGPRLIDFGIARHEGATALTATGAVIGTPGYLAPEQASAGSVGPACDVFSLGCVLVYAATGRRPFGEGGAAGVLFRTVHEEPDLTGVPPELLPLLVGCLSKDPAARPSAGRVGDELEAAGGADSDRTRKSPPDPRVAWAPGGAAGTARGGGGGAFGTAPDGAAETAPDRAPPGEPDTAPRAGDWFAPPGLAALIAERSAQALALPDPEPPPAPLAPGEDAAAPAAGLTRRRLLIAGAAGGVVVTGGSTAAWLARRRSAGAASGSGTPPTYTIGLHATSAAPAAPPGWRPAWRTGSTTASETAAHLCVTRPYDRMLAPGLISYVVHTRPAERVLLVQDDTGLGGELAAGFREAMPADATVITHALPGGDTGSGAAARKAVTSRADAVVLASGDAARAARLATALADEGYSGTRIAAGPALGPAFLTGAGAAADGWVFAEAYADPAALPSARTFTADHRRRFGAPPAMWAAEAYDAVGLIARAAGAAAAPGSVRGGMARLIRSTEHRGIVRPLAFRPSIRQVRYENGIFLYRIEQGRPRFLGPFGEL